METEFNFTQQFYPHLLAYFNGKNWSFCLENIVFNLFNVYFQQYMFVCGLCKAIICKLAIRAIANFQKNSVIRYCFRNVKMKNGTPLFF